MSRNRASWKTTTTKNNQTMGIRRCNNATYNTTGATPNKKKKRPTPLRPARVRTRTPAMPNPAVYTQQCHNNRLRSCSYTSRRRKQIHATWSSAPRNVYRTSYNVFQLCLIGHRPSSRNTSSSPAIDSAMKYSCPLPLYKTARSQPYAP